MTDSTPPASCMHLASCSPSFKLICAGVLTLYSPFCGGALTMRLPSCRDICGFRVRTRPRHWHAPGSNASSFAAGAFSAPARWLDAGGSVSGWCSAHKLAALPLLVYSTTRSQLPSRLCWLSVTHTHTRLCPSIPTGTGDGSTSLASAVYNASLLPPRIAHWQARPPPTQSRISSVSPPLPSPTSPSPLHLPPLPTPLVHERA